MIYYLLVCLILKCSSYPKLLYIYPRMKGLTLAIKNFRVFCGSIGLGPLVLENTVKTFNYLSNAFCLQKGCSVRFLNPQSYSKNVWRILSVLQDFFNCSVGANV